jgi:hypothetical protein
MIPVDCGGSMTIVTLLTDFGLKDGNVGVMKGVILGIAPATQIVDLGHLISPQDVAEAALILARSSPYFPPGAIHVTVVDPGVGTARRPMAARLGAQFVVGPDNGLITLVLQRATQEGWPVEFVHLNQPQYWLSGVSHVFHGRDIFAPAAAHLARGIPLTALGAPFDDPVLLRLPQPERTPTGLRGEIIHVDHFGNLAANIRREHLGDLTDVLVRLGGVEIRGLVKTFGERSPGELAALWGSTGNLIVAEVNGSAAARLGARVGDPLSVEFAGL